MSTPTRRSERSRVPNSETFYQKAERELRESLDSSRSSVSTVNRTPVQKKRGRPSGTKTPSSSKSSKSSSSIIQQKNNDDIATNQGPEKDTIIVDENGKSTKRVQMMESEEDNELVMNSSEGETDTSDEEVSISARNKNRKRKPKNVSQKTTPLKKQKQGKLHENIHDIFARKKNTSKDPQIQRQFHESLLLVTKKILSEFESVDNSLLVSLIKCSHKEGYKNANKSLGVGIENLARKIVDQLSHDSNGAQILLLNLIFRSIGCSYDNLIAHDVDLDDVSDNLLASFIEQVVEDMAETPADAILFCADPQGAATGKSIRDSRARAATKEYRKLFEKFWFETGVAIANHDPSINENNSTNLLIARDLILRLIEFVWVGVPDIRAAFSIAIYQLGASWLQCTTQLQDKLNVAIRQLQSAKRLNSSSMSRKVIVLQQQVDYLKGSIAGLEDLVKNNVMNVFLKRYRDKNPFIRTESLVALSSFTLIRPDLFLNGMYLKYFGWLLSDKDSLVRKAAIMGLLAPFRNNSRKVDVDDNIGGKSTSLTPVPIIDTSGMNSVIQKFLSRLADCVIDVDVEVQESAMELLLYLVRLDFFDDVENDNIWHQINLRALDAETSLLVRRNALYFVMEQLQQFDTGSSDHDADAVERIKALVEWTSHVLSDSDIPIDCIRFNLMDLVVASLRAMPEHKSLVCNWTAILKALQGDFASKGARMARKSVGKGDQRHDSVQQRVLLRWLVSSAEMEVQSIRSSFGGNIDSDPMLQDIDRDLLHIQQLHFDASIDVEIKKKDKRRQNSTSQEELTLSLLRSLPELLVSFKTETQVLQSLTSLSRYLLPSVFNLPSRKNDFHSLLSVLSTTFMESTDEVVLCNCALALVSLTRGDHARRNEALLVLKKTASLLRNRLFELTEDKRQFLEDTKETKYHQHSNKDGVTGSSHSLDSEHSLCLCLRRLRILSKRWYLPTLLIDNAEVHEEEDFKLEMLFNAVTDYMYRELNCRKLMSSQDSTSDSVVPKVWSGLDDRTHMVVASSLSEAMDILLSLIAWRLSSVVEAIKENNEFGMNINDVNEHIVLRMRNQLIQLLLLCYEQVLDQENIDKYSKSHVQFSESVQELAGRVTGDIRMLFPKMWSLSTSKLLSSFALTQETHIVGGFVRFVRSQEKKLRQCSENDDGGDTVRRLLLPMARGLAGNWLSGNRREAGVVLAHIAGSGVEAQNLAQSLSRVCKKIHPVRFLEAHMAYLRQDFSDWIASRPDEIENDRPTDTELADFELAEKNFKAKLESIEIRASRLSALLGVGVIKDKALAAALVGFIREGIRFAFSNTPDGDCDDILLGDHLPFLRPLSKYLNWIRRNNGPKDIIRSDLDQRETELRSDPDFDDIYEENIAAISTFRSAGGLGPFVPSVEDETTIGRLTVQTDAESLASTQGNRTTLTNVDANSQVNAMIYAMTDSFSQGYTTATKVDASVYTKGGSNLIDEKVRTRRHLSDGGSIVSNPSIKSKYSSSQSSLSPLPEEDEEDINVDNDLSMQDTSSHQDDDISQLSHSPRRTQSRHCKK